jgi:hypothetical protein
MSLTRAIYSGDGSANTFTVPFPYLNRSHVRVYQNGIELPSPMMWVWDNDTTVRILVTPPEGAGIVIARKTPRSTRLVDFQNGAVLTEADLDTAHLQHHYVTQEIIDEYEALLNKGRERAATGSGIETFTADQLLDDIIGVALESELLATLQQNIEDITTTSQDILELALRVADIEEFPFDFESLQAQIIQETGYRIDGDDALAFVLSLIGVANGTNTAFILDTSTVKLDSDLGETLATKLTYLTVTAEAADGLSQDNAAAILVEQNARVDAVNALAEDITILQTSVGENTASVETLGLSVDGIEAKYTVKVDVNGYVAGYGIIATDNDGVPTSEFAVLADKFIIAHPGGDDPDTLVIPFVVEDGVVYMQDVVIGNALISSVEAGKLTAGDITALIGITTGQLLLTEAGKIVLNGKAYGDSTAGAILEMHSGNPRIDIGNGTAYLRFNTTDGLIIGGDIVATGNIKANAVTTTKIAAGAVSGTYYVRNSSSFDTAGSYAWTEAVTLEDVVVPDIGGNVPVMVNWAALFSGDNSDSPSVKWRVRRIRISASGTATGTIFEREISNGWKGHSASFNLVDSVAAGTYDYELSVATSSVRQVTDCSVHATQLSR